MTADDNFAPLVQTALDALRQWAADKKVDGCVGRGQGQSSPALAWASLGRHKRGGVAAHPVRCVRVVRNVASAR